MTLKELQQVEEKGKNVFQVLDGIAKEFQQQTGLTFQITKDLSLFASGKPCFVIKKEGFFGKKLFYVRNVITNPRQPSPMFIRIFNKEHEKILLNLMDKKKEEIEKNLGVKVTYHSEDSV